MHPLASHLVLPAMVIVFAVWGPLTAVAEHATPSATPLYDIGELGTLGGETSRAYDVNDRGWVVGHADDAEGRRRAVMWRDDRVIDLGTLGGDDATALAVNDAGQVVGGSTSRSGQELLESGSRAFGY